MGATLTVVSLTAIIWSCHTTPYIPHWESVLHDETK